MTANPSSVGSSTADSTGSNGTDFRKIYVMGVIGWLVGMAALFGASWIFSKPETIPIAMLWMISHCWIAFFFGLVLMVLRGMGAKVPIAKSVMAYVLPMVLLAGIAGICMMIYPDAGFRLDLLTYLPMVVVFYCFGCLWMALGGVDGGAFARAVIPALFGGVIILGFVAVPAFASDSFRYRSAFRFDAKESSIQNGMLILEGILRIKKPGSYEFLASRYIWLDHAEDGDCSDVEVGEIQWGEAGAPKEGALGEFPLRISWKKGVPQQESGQLPHFDGGFTLEVRKPDQGGKLVYSINANMEAIQLSSGGVK